MPKPNIELLRRTLDHIKANPAEWNQGLWRVADSCGTAMCFAGWAATLAGAQWAHGEYGGYAVMAEPDDVWGRTFVPAEFDQPVISVEERARRILGLTPEESDDLFHPSNNLAYLEQAVDELCAKADEARPMSERFSFCSYRSDVFYLDGEECWYVCTLPEGHDGDHQRCVSAHG